MWRGSLTPVAGADPCESPDLTAHPTHERKIMAHGTAKIELENDRVKVTRVKTGPQGHAPPSARHDRLIIYLQDGRVLRTEGGKKEEIQRKAGDAVWRARSEHKVENLEDADHEVLIIELKG
jgi:hypothetical protein